MQKSLKLMEWQQRLADGDAQWSAEVRKMDHREKVYNGLNTLGPMVDGDTEGCRTPHVRNIVFENIESMVSSNIPAVKVTARHPENEKKATVIEHLIRNVMNELPMEQINDMAERTVPIQGGVFYLVEWDDTRHTHNTTGQIHITLIHPKQIVPQPGVYTGIEDMDWFILKIPTTKGALRRKYGVELEEEGESEPDIKSSEDTTSTKDSVTQYIGYERDENGQYNKYSWVNDTELEDLDNYQARRVPVCARCHRMRPLKGQVIRAAAQVEGMEEGPDLEAQMAGRMLARKLADREDQGLEDQSFLEGVDVITEEPERYDGGRCPWCGADEWIDEEDDYEQVFFPIEKSDGTKIPGAVAGMDSMGGVGLRPTKIPFYRPDRFPLIMQRNVSTFGQLLGNSDVDVIEDQQNTTNRMEKKIIDRLLGAGSIITLPNDGSVRVDPEDHRIFYVSDLAKKQMIDLYDFKGDLQYELTYLAQVYEESRQMLGITDSYQGRPDSTATSGKAKEIQAQQAAGRMESKRTMKAAAFSEIDQLIFQYYLAYADEPRPIMYKAPDGTTMYEEFSRYDFVEQDGDGVWYWDDEYLFGIDKSEPLASNREAMWQETRMNFESGTFGNPQDTDTLILFWETMEELHYPGAAQKIKFLQEKAERDRQMAMEMAQMQTQAQAVTQGRQNQTEPAGAAGQQMPGGIGM